MTHQFQGPRDRRATPNSPEWLTGVADFVQDTPALQEGPYSISGLVDFLQQAAEDPSVQRAVHWGKQTPEGVQKWVTEDIPDLAQAAQSVGQFRRDPVETLRGTDWGAAADLAKGVSGKVGEVYREGAQKDGVNQGVVDAVQGVYEVAKRSGKGILELIGQVMDERGLAGLTGPEDFLGPAGKGGGLVSGLLMAKKKFPLPDPKPTSLAQQIYTPKDRRGFLGPVPPEYLEAIPDNHHHLLIPDPKNAASKATDIRQVSATFNPNIEKGGDRRTPWDWADDRGARVLDIGGGREDDAIRHMQDNFGVELQVQDVYNRDPAHNARVLAEFSSEPADYVTLNSVLNVIPTPEARRRVLQSAYDLVVPGGELRISIHRGSGDKKVSEGALDAQTGLRAKQNNRPAGDYLEEVGNVFGPANVTVHGQFIVARRSPDILNTLGKGIEVEPQTGRVIPQAFPTAEKGGELVVNPDDLTPSPVTIDAMYDAYDPALAGTVNPKTGKPVTALEKDVKLMTDERWITEKGEKVLDPPYVNLPDKMRDASDPKEIIEFMKEHEAENLVYLFERMDPEDRARAMKWYDGANKIANRFAKKYNVTVEQAAGVIAALSPQKEWFSNVAMAERILDMWTHAGDQPFDAKMMQVAASIPAIRGKTQGNFTWDDVVRIEGKTLHEIEDPVLQAIWLRVYSQAHHNPQHRIVTPEGDPGDYVYNMPEIDKKTGEMIAMSKPGALSWSDAGSTASAVRVLRDGSMGSISRAMGGAHKVRSFYNNIIFPNDPGGGLSLPPSVTMDTHAIAASLMRPLGASHPHVKHSMGSGSKAAATGLQGLYPLHADAYREASKRVGLEYPRQLQSVTWEAVRGLFSPAYKRNVAAVGGVEDAWKQFQTGAADAPTTRRRIYEFAGGIDRPSWAEGR